MVNFANRSANNTFYASTAVVTPISEEQLQEEAMIAAREHQAETDAAEQQIRDDFEEEMLATGQFPELEEEVDELDVDPFADEAKAAATKSNGLVSNGQANAASGNRLPYMESLGRAMNGDRSHLQKNLYDIWQRALNTHNRYNPRGERTHVHSLAQASWKLREIYMEVQSGQLRGKDLNSLVYNNIWGDKPVMVEFTRFDIVFGLLNGRRPAKVGDPAFRGIEMQAETFRSYGNIYANPGLHYTIRMAGQSIVISAEMLHYILRNAKAGTLQSVPFTTKAVMPRGGDNKPQINLPYDGETLIFPANTRFEDVEGHPYCFPKPVRFSTEYNVFVWNYLPIAMQRGEVPAEISEKELERVQMRVKALKACLAKADDPEGTVYAAQSADELAQVQAYYCWLQYGEWIFRMPGGMCAGMTPAIILDIEQFIPLWNALQERRANDNATRRAGYQRPASANGTSSAATSALVVAEEVEDFDPFKDIVMDVDAL